MYARADGKEWVLYKGSGLVGRIELLRTWDFKSGPTEIGSDELAFSDLSLT